MFERRRGPMGAGPCDVDLNRGRSPPPRLTAAGGVVLLSGAHPRARQLRVRVEVTEGCLAKAKLALAKGKVAPGKPFGAGQPALR